MAYNPLQYLTQNQPNTFAMLSQVGRSLGEGRRRQLELSRQADQEAAGQRAAKKLGLLAQDLAGQRATGGLTGQGAAGNLELLTKAEPQFTPEMQGEFYQDALASGQGGLLLGEYGRLTDVDAPIDWDAVGNLQYKMDILAQEALRLYEQGDKAGYDEKMKEFSQLNREHVRLTKGESYASNVVKDEKTLKKLSAEATKAEKDAEIAAAEQNKRFIDYVNKALNNTYERNAKGIEAIKKAIDYAGQARDNILAVVKSKNINDAILSQITRALVKIQDPNSAVMQGEAEAMLGTGILTDIRVSLEKLEKVMKDGELKAAENRAQTTDVNKLIEAYNALHQSLVRNRQNVLAGQMGDEALQDELILAQDMSGVKDPTALSEVFKRKAQSQWKIPPVPAKITESANQTQQQSTNAIGTPKNKQEFLQKWKPKK